MNRCRICGSPAGARVDDLVIFDICQACADDPEREANVKRDPATAIATDATNEIAGHLWLNVDQRFDVHGIIQEHAAPIIAAAIAAERENGARLRAALAAADGMAAALDEIADMPCECGPGVEIVCVWCAARSALEAWRAAGGGGA